jgi:HPt (histidine-containing phosphotransfer) domain-containing protein
MPKTVLVVDDSPTMRQMSELAHRLRGSAGMYGLPAVSVTAGRLEDACRSGQAVDRLEALLAALAAECDGAKPAGV